MNTLKVGSTSKAHCFTSQIVSQLWVPVESLTKYAEFFVDAPNGALPGNFFRNNWDLSYQHIYLGHPLKLKGVWANIFWVILLVPPPLRGKHRTWLRSKKLAALEAQDFPELLPAFVDVRRKSLGGLKTLKKYYSIPQRFGFGPFFFGLTGIPLVAHVCASS